MIYRILLTALITINAATFLSAAPIGYQSTITPSTVISPITDDFDDLIKEAFRLYKDKKYDEALAKCEEAVKLRPTDFRPFYLSGIVYMAQWKMKSASESFGKAISLNPREKVLYLNKAKADRYRNAKDEAVTAARAAIKIDPNYAEAYYVLADALSVGAREYDEIIAAYRKAIELKPNLLKAYTQLGMFLKASKDIKGAEEIYKKVMELDRNKMVGRFELGRLLVREGRLKEARELWKGRTSDTDNTFPNFVVLLERAEKKKAAEEALAKNPDDPQALLQMGLMVMEGESWVIDGRQEKAIVYFRKALEIKPDFAEAQVAICKAYVQIAATFKDKNEETDKEIAKLRKMDPKLADEITAYRKSYFGGLKAGVPPPDQ
jgi:tetratricopeptide (TPR) repeat protein